MTPQSQAKSLELARNQANKMLRNKLSPEGFWEGRLSSSALSTAVACFALDLYESPADQESILKAKNWLIENQNQDGGWGDTDRSKSNLSTTLLCYFCLNGRYSGADQALNHSKDYLLQKIPSLSGEDITETLLKFYGKDQSFSVPILTMGAISGSLGKNIWQYIPQLPFELSLLPQSLYRFLNLSVVSYALPALISMGIAHHFSSPSKNLLLRCLRDKLVKKSLTLLSHKQPQNGGFLEATPLTAFVLMSLIFANQKDHIICQKAYDFLKISQRKDGSWPIDTHLSTWLTSLSVKAVAHDLNYEEQSRIKNYFRQNQYLDRHPFTGAEPGAWAWTHLPGGVPDADDTSGALIALAQLQTGSSDHKVALAGLNWLKNIQNSNGGVPTFCRGWGQLPFDKSCPDITAHAIAAFAHWQKDIIVPQTDQFIQKALAYLCRCQKDNGSWIPLWFGNENAKQCHNPIYGTALVLSGLSSLKDSPLAHKLTTINSHIEKAIDFIRQCKNSQGCWGGDKNLPVSIEETALASYALLCWDQGEETHEAQLWLAEQVMTSMNTKSPLKASPIGLYFSSLWYYEDLYPLIFTCLSLNHPYYRNNDHNLN
ncbi:MAG: squalene--hopene cyclase [Planctomycetes bacterium]|nr:squalene--hopene cyclase [Planctomycetota bacterium]